MIAYPGLCPGLVCHAPSGLKITWKSRRNEALARPCLRLTSRDSPNRYRYRCRNRNIPREIRLRFRSRFRAGGKMLHCKNLTHLQRFFALKDSRGRGRFGAHCARLSSYGSGDDIAAVFRFSEGSGLGACGVAGVEGCGEERTASILERRASQGFTHRTTLGGKGAAQSPARKSPAKGLTNTSRGVLW